MKYFKSFVSVFALLMPFAMAAVIPAQGSHHPNIELTEAFLNGVKNYKNANYDEAIQAFEKVADAGIRNGKLFYNLGNAYFKEGQLGHAILWYERADRLIPKDPDLKFNLNYARERVEDYKEKDPQQVYRILFFWNHLLNQSQLQWLAIVLNSFGWVLVTIKAWSHRRSLNIPIGITFFCAVVFISTGLYRDYQMSRYKQAIVLSQTIDVRSGLTAQSTTLFQLHSGAKVRIEKENKDHFRIFFSDGKIGWASKSQLGVI